MTQHVELDRNMSAGEKFRLRSGLFFKNETWELQRVIKRERSGSEKGIGPENNKGLDMLPPATEPGVIVDKMEEDVVVEQVYKSRSEVYQAVKEAYEVLSLALKSMWLVHNVPF